MPTPLLPLAALASGFDAPLFRQRFLDHARRWSIAYLGVAFTAWMFQAHYGFALNLSPSLPHSLYLIEKGAMPQRGELVAFRAGTPQPVTEQAQLVKILTGVPGDTVARTERTFFVNNTPVGSAKTHSLKGVPLALGPIGTIPPGRYYVSAPHPDSLDSRYQRIGWIAASQIIGRAHALF